MADAAVKEIEADNHDVIILNFANPDMVGHSGMLEPTIKAVEATDECLGRVVEAVLAKGGVGGDHRRPRQRGHHHRRERLPAHGAYDEPGAVHRDRSKC